MDSVKTEKTTEPLVIERRFNATRARVFQAWTDAAQLKQWFGPKGVVVASVEVDLRVGGAYSIEMIEPEGEKISHGGTYREISPPKRLVFTWVLDGQHCLQGEEGIKETLVTVTFHEQENATLVRLTHEWLPNEKTRAGHEFGWNGCFDSLAGLLEK